MEWKKENNFYEKRLEALLRDNELAQENRNELWRKHDQAMFLLATGVLFILSQMNSIPDYVFLVIPFAFLTWAMFFLSLFWDAVVVSKYQNEVRKEIDYILGKITLSLREKIETKYWNPDVAKEELGIGTPRRLTQLISIVLIIMFHFFFASFGIVWLWKETLNICLLVLAIIIYVTIPFLWIFNKYKNFVNQYILNSNSYSSFVSRK